MAPVDLFSTSSMPDKMPSIEEEVDAANFHVQTPLLYIGTHNRQLYIQESDRAKARSKKVRLDLQAPQSSQFPKVSWRPYLISSHTRDTIFCSREFHNREGSLMQFVQTRLVKRSRSLIEKIEIF